MVRLLLLTGIVGTLITSSPSLVVRDIGGERRSLLTPAEGRFDLLFFLSPDCPISNRYIPEIVRICEEFKARGVGCYTIYPNDDPASAVTRHRREFGLNGIPAIIDRDQAVARAVGARVTPEAALYATAGRVYRGRIDDLYVDIGRARPKPTQHDLRVALGQALAGRPVERPETESVGCSLPAPPRIDR
jgi:hypothetical protein